METAVVTGLMAWSASAWHLVLMRFLLGIFAGFIPASAPFMTMNTPKEKIGYALGGVQSGAFAGNIFGPLIGGVLAEVRRQLQAGREPVFSQGILHIAPVAAMFVTGFLIQFSMMSTSPFLSTYVASMWHDPDHLAVMAGLAVSISGVSVMIFSPILGKLSDRWGSERILLVCLLGSFICYGAQALIPSIWSFLLFRFGTGMCVGGLLPAVNSTIRKHAPKGAESLTFGYYHSALFLGNLTGPLFGGFFSGIVSMKGIILSAALLFLLNGSLVKVRYFADVTLMSFFRKEGVQAAAAASIAEPKHRGEK
ncbi:MFS transporter [Paenibacillus beijingensis]|uniref:Major facilitator superfamily (MFS) profile domain-containing protein n=1 Tax=Paenibacillus beijingensis TaxID=1126833 RepID=A0A0D5NH91_9BACL|nr:MFS transporter [Paenibacillus beijingensis]AJY74749.1 hypothetical protein VN24_09330 [Paenibacillus beijingensis]